MKKVMGIGLILMGILATTLFGAEILTMKEWGQLKKMRIMQHVNYETYLNTDQGLASVLGYHFDTFVTDRFFGSISIMGAVGGNRGGYGIAAVGGGVRIPLSERMAWDARLMVGSGGGGGLPAGGGFALEGLTGLSYAYSETLFLEAKVGYLTFPTGDFNTSVITLGVAYQMQRLYLPWTTL